MAFRERAEAEAKSQLTVAASGRLVQEERPLRTCLEAEKVAEEISEEEEADAKGNSNNWLFPVDLEAQTHHNNS